MKTKGIIFALSGLFFITGTLCSCDSDVDASNGDPMDGFSTDGTSQLTPGGGDGNNGDEPLTEAEKIYDRKNGNKEVKYDKILKQDVCEKIIEAINSNSAGTDYIVGELAEQRWYGFDSDGDGIKNKEELDLKLNPCVADSDGDGVVDGADPDPKNGGQFEEKEKKLMNDLCKDRPVAETLSFGDSESGAAYVKLDGFEYAQVNADPVDGMIAFDNGKVKADAPQEAIYALSISTKGKTRMWKAFLDSFLTTMPFSATEADNRTLTVENWSKIFGDGYEVSEEGVIRQGARSTTFTIAQKNYKADETAHPLAKLYRDPKGMRNYLAEVIVELAKKTDPEVVKEVKALTLFRDNTPVADCGVDGKLTVSIRMQDYEPEGEAAGAKKYINVTLAVICSSSLTQKTGTGDYSEHNTKVKENKKLLDEIVSGTLTNPANRYHKNARTCEIVDPKSQGQEVDFLWVIDNSSSMKDEQVGISEIIDIFTKKLGETSIDYRLGVTTTDAYLLDEAPCTQLFYTKGEQDPVSRLFTSIRGSSKVVDGNDQNFANDTEAYQKFGGPGTVYSNIPSLDKMPAAPEFKLVSQYCNVDMKTGLRGYHELVSILSSHRDRGMTYSSGFIMRGKDISTTEASARGRAFRQLIKSYGINEYYHEDNMGANIHGYGIEDGLESAVITMKRLMKPYHEGENSPTKAEFDRINEALKGKTSTANTYEMRKGALKYLIFVSDEENRIFKSATKGLDKALMAVTQGIERKAGEANRDNNATFDDQTAKLEGSKTSNACIYGPKYVYECECPGFIFVVKEGNDERKVILKGVSKEGGDDTLCALENHPKFEESRASIEAMGLNPMQPTGYLEPKCTVKSRRSLAGNNYFDRVYDKIETEIGMILPADLTTPYACKKDTTGNTTAEMCAGHEDSLAFYTIDKNFDTTPEDSFNQAAVRNSNEVNEVWREKAYEYPFKESDLAIKQGKRRAVAEWYINYLRKIAMSDTEDAGDITGAAIIGKSDCGVLQSNGTKGADADFSYTMVAKGLSRVSPGMSASVCQTDKSKDGGYGQTMDSLFEDVVGRIASFTLRDYPIVSSLKVYVVDGENNYIEIPSKPTSDRSPYWTYNPQFNSITVLNIGDKMKNARVVFHYAKWESKQA